MPDGVNPPPSRFATAPLSGGPWRAAKPPLQKKEDVNMEIIRVDTLDNLMEDVEAILELVLISFWMFWHSIQIVHLT